MPKIVKNSKKKAKKGTFEKLPKSLGKTVFSGKN
jgi:hypothetical protein